MLKLRRLLEMQVRLAVGYTVVFRRNVMDGEINLGGDTIEVIHKALSTHEVTRGCGIEEKETGSDPCTPSAERSDQTTGPRQTHSLAPHAEAHRAERPNL